jgi:hypothetical protein
MGKACRANEDLEIAHFTNRGFSYWESQDRSDRRLFYATNNMLHALDARTGKLMDSKAAHAAVSSVARQEIRVRSHGTPWQAG